MDDIKVQEVKGKASQGPVHVELDKDVLITPEEIHKLRQSHPDLSSNPIVQKWWKFMADIMETNSDFSPVSTQLEEVFYMD